MRLMFVLLSAGIATLGIIIVLGLNGMLYYQWSGGYGIPVAPRHRLAHLGQMKNLDTGVWLGSRPIGVPLLPGVKERLHLRNEVPATRALGATSTSAKSLISYVYYQTPVADVNLRHFIAYEGKQFRSDVDYIVVIQGGKSCLDHESLDFPKHSNWTIIRRPNRGYDFGGHNAALESARAEGREYMYYVFMNSGVIGPFLTPARKKRLGEAHWSSEFAQKINDHVKLVGTTIATLPWYDAGGAGPRIESFCFVTDRLGLKLLQDEGSIFRDHKSKRSAVIDGEYGTTRCIFRHGFNIDCMIKRYTGFDWRDRKNHAVNDNMHPSRKNALFGETIDPYEVIMHKWYWAADGGVAVGAVLDLVPTLLTNPDFTTDYYDYIASHTDLEMLDKREAFIKWLEDGQRST